LETYLANARFCGMACSLSWAPLPASLAGGAGARPDHSISRLAVASMGAKRRRSTAMLHRGTMPLAATISGTKTSKFNRLSTTYDTLESSKCLPKSFAAGRPLWGPVRALSGVCGARFLSMLLNGGYGYEPQS
jgi:hypothetical protein